MKFMDYKKVDHAGHCDGFARILSVAMAIVMIAILGTRLYQDTLAPSRVDTEHVLVERRDATRLTRKTHQNENTMAVSSTSHDRDEGAER